MSHYPPEIVKIVTIDPTTGKEVKDTTYYGVAYSDDEGYAISRSAETLKDLQELVGGDLSDDKALIGYITEVFPHMEGADW